MALAVFGCARLPSVLGSARERRGAVSIEHVNCCHMLHVMFCEKNAFFLLTMSPHGNVLTFCLNSSICGVDEDFFFKMSAHAHCIQILDVVFCRVETKENFQHWFHMPFLTSKNSTCQLCSFVQHRGHSMLAGSAEAKSQLNLTLSSSNIIQHANFIDFNVLFFRGGGG